MAEIKAFQALRFTEKAGEIGQLVCPPYDIINEEQRKAYLAKNPNNIIRLELPKDGANPYTEAGRVLAEFEKKGLLDCDSQDGLYIYEIEFIHNSVKKSIKGFVCRVKLEEFSKGIVLPHEETLSKAKTDRFNLMNATGCNFSQIYSLYMDGNNPTFNKLESASAQTPAIEFTDGEGLVHKLWVITDTAVITSVCSDFEERKLYIADGHHRYETALNYRNAQREAGKAKEGDSCDYVMMMLVNMENDGLVVFPTHRIVKNLENPDLDKIIADCKEYFTVSENEDIKTVSDTLDRLYQEDKKAFALYTGGEHYTLLTLKDLSVMDGLLPGVSAASKGLDVTVLHSLILEKLFGIDKENMANQVNLGYTRDIDEAVGMVQNGSANCSFIMNPTKVTEIRDVASAGEKMPQKSTYFYPKLITGLVMNQF